MMRKASSAPSSSSAGTARNSSSSTDSNTPTPPGTLLMMPAAIAMRNSPAKARETDRSLRRQQHVQNPGGAQQIAAGDGDLREGDARARDRNDDLAPPQRLVPACTPA